MSSLYADADDIVADFGAVDYVTAAAVVAAVVAYCNKIRLIIFL